MGSGQVLLIGLDAAEIGLIQQWSQEGCLPHLKALLEEGCWGRLTSTAEMLSGSVWPSLFTGTLPGKHGRYYPLKPQPGQQGVADFSVDCEQLPLWKFLAAAGARCVIMDVPFSPLLPGLSGLQIIDWGTYDKSGRSRSTPSGMYHELVKRWGHHPLERTIKEPLCARDYQHLLQKLLKGASLKGNVVTQLLTSEPWEFCFVVFGETHPAGHYYWHLGQEPSSTNRADRGSTGLKQIYMAVDRAIGRILASIHRNTTVMVISGHGMGPNLLGYHLLPELLRCLGLLAIRDAKNATGQLSIARDWLKRARDLVPIHFRKWVSHHLSPEIRHHLSSRWASADIDWRNTRVFPLPTDLQGYLRINLKGREPQGIVEPGREYEELCDRIREALTTLVHPSDGRPVVRQIIQTDAIFPGPYRDHLPDLIVLWDESRPITEAFSPAIGLLSERSPDLRSGNHKSSGFFIISGPQIRARQLTKEVHICDIAPTVLALFGLATPGHMDGKTFIDNGIALAAEERMTPFSVSTFS